MSIGRNDFNWNYVNEDETSVDITVVTDEMLAILEKFDIQSLSISTDMKFYIQADGSFNPSGISTHNIDLTTSVTVPTLPTPYGLGE